jgi:hypothetical protein
MNRKFTVIVLVYMLLVSQAFAAPVIENTVGFKIIYNSSSPPRYVFGVNVKDAQDVDQIATFKLYKSNSQNLINTFEIDGNATLACNDSYVDLVIDYDDSDLNIMTRNLSISPLNATVSDIIIDDTVTPDIPGFYIYRAYKVEFPGNFKFKNIDLKINYDDLSFDNENNIVLKRCGNYDLATDTCLESWTDVSITVSISGKYVLATIPGFSVYGLGEPEESGSTTTTTTTSSETATTTQTTQQQSSSSGGSSGGSSGSGGGYIPPSTSSSSSSPSSTSTTVKIITPTTTTTSSTTVTKSNSPIGMSTFVQQNSVYLAIPIIAVAGFLVWKFYLTNKAATAPKFYRVRRSLPKKKRSSSYSETKLFLG